MVSEELSESSVGEEYNWVFNAWNSNRFFFSQSKIISRLSDSYVHNILRLLFNSRLGDDLSKIEVSVKGTVIQVALEEWEEKRSLMFSWGLKKFEM